MVPFLGPDKRFSTAVSDAHIYKDVIVALKRQKAKSRKLCTLDVFEYGFHILQYVLSSFASGPCTLIK